METKITRGNISNIPSVVADTFKSLNKRFLCSFAGWAKSVFAKDADRGTVREVVHAKTMLPRHDAVSETRVTNHGWYATVFVPKNTSLRYVSTWLKRASCVGM